MRKKSVLLIALSLSFVLFLFTAFRTPPLAPNVQVTQRYRALLEAFQRDIAHFQTVAKNFASEKGSKKELWAAFTTMRSGYKNVEFLLGYLENEEVEARINGGPLQSVDAEATTPRVVEPVGLQMIETLVYDDSVHLRKAEIVAIAAQLSRDFEELEERQAKIVLTDKLVFEAVRFEIIRIATLGITGFDTPASGRSIIESGKAFGAAMLGLMPYLTEFEADNKEKTARLIAQITDAQTFFDKDRSFEKFDRVVCLKNHLNPLYSSILDFQNDLKISTTPSEYAKNTGVNPLARNIFDVDFLEAAFYTGLSPKDSRAETVELGRLLFFDPILSQNNERACASCHDPLLGFADGKAKSMAIDKKTTVARNAPTVVNAIFAKKWFYDLRSDDMQHQIEQVVTSEKEFHTDFAVIVKKIKQNTAYRRIFKKVFGKPIESAHISTAIMAYEQSLVALNSPFDRYMRGEITTIDPAILRGFNIFAGSGNCATCHFAPTFSGLVPPLYHESESEVLGVPLADVEENATIDDDLGRFANKKALDQFDFLKYSFKTPTLRNVGLTAPYMHNGVFKALDDVMIFYNKGGGSGIGIDLPNQTLSHDVLALSPDERDDVIAFLHSLTDTTRTTLVPQKLPAFVGNKALNKRKIGGVF